MVKMSQPASNELTQTLQSIQDGDDSAQNRLLALSYDELRRIAAGLMRRERADHTLQPTALVHEAIMRFFPLSGKNSDVPAIPNRAYFFGAMAQAMRRILVEHARTKNSQKRGGDFEKVPLDFTLQCVEQVTGSDMLELDELLDRLQQLDDRTCRVVMLRCFAGLEISDIAKQLSVSPSTIDREWRFARAWLKKEMEE